MAQSDKSLSMDVETEETAESKTPVTTKHNRVKGPNEDSWLRIVNDPDMDRNRMDSLRRAHLNPDLFKPCTLSCYCGAEVSLNQSWYVMTLDGNLVCNSCARCHRCGREAMQISRRLVSIDGLVLCYQCIQFFGHPCCPKWKPRVEPMTMKNPLEAQTPLLEGSSSTATNLPHSSQNLSNSEYYDYNVTRVDRCLYMPKEDLRRKLRSRYYEPPIERLPSSDDPCVVPPAYLAENSHMPPMLCPACNIIAVGPKCYVVPSMARVYHRRCFCCCNCKEALTNGLKIPYLHFEYCSCNVPHVWCTRPGCRAARLLHHKVSKCHLGCVRPGGRVQMDYISEPVPDELRRHKRAKKTQEHSASIKAETMTISIRNQDSTIEV